MGKLRLASLVAAALLTVTAYGQTINASLTGAITDSTGAVVPVAKVQITNSATNVQTGVIAHEDGTYEAPSLPPGTYVVTVSAGGFKTARRTDVVLDVSHRRASTSRSRSERSPNRWTLPRRRKSWIPPPPASARWSIPTP